jgi:UPF0271 protein
MRLTAQEVEDLVIYQVAALAGFAAAEGTRLAHVKAHGALYNMAVHDRALSDAIARAVRAVDRSLILFGLPGSALLRSGEAAGLAVAAEGFADRAYEPDGTLTPRSRAGAVIHDAEAVVARAIRMVSTGRVIAADGSEIALRIDTLCTHGDTHGAAELTRRLREALERRGVELCAPGARASRP